MSELPLITSEEQWESWLEESRKQPLLLLKHSTQCPISAEAFEAFRTFASTSQAKSVRIGVVTVIEHRPVSNAIAERLQVKHESPQALLIKDGKAVWHASHWNVTQESLAQAVAAHT
ncbi:bacillithiol system redox-active protein YtxJ [Polycladomyces subterraneus]|uniref:Bacillithiol system redox-active protein YtxJ n=1 Tax=Polycladomyces subterraneus TaxID=1016997 RepID=A0ABT8IRB9_9BACL|nr:bacillithiol system redox-active protein YtxJ [Polycladomyces subterraneus]MDN4595350.1 bacillithiol system redox-active protein YtxJ [Polycladomyces subterraneus]